MRYDCDSKFKELATDFQTVAPIDPIEISYQLRILFDFFLFFIRKGFDDMLAVYLHWMQSRNDDLRTT